MAKVETKIEPFEILIREHHQMLIAYVRSIVGHVPLADDIMQEAFLRAFRNLDSLKDQAAFGPWIRTVARNIARDELKARNREIDLDCFAITHRNAGYTTFLVA